MRNFHLPLPDETYEHLRAAAERSRVPATTLAREAIDLWLRQQLRKARDEAIAAYAAEIAGTSLGAEVRRGEVHWADLVPRSGSEQTGRRPVIVVSHDAFNQTAGWKSIIVVPISTSPAQARRGPTVVEIPAGAGGLAKTSYAICHRVTTPDRAKLAKRAGTLPGEVLDGVA